MSLEEQFQKAMLRRQLLEKLAEMREAREIYEMIIGEAQKFDARLSAFAIDLRLVIGVLEQAIAFAEAARAYPELSEQAEALLKNIETLRLMSVKEADGG